MFLYDANDVNSMEQKMEQLEKEDERKRGIMAKLIDLSNSSTKGVIDANTEKAIIHFARHEGDTGSPEVQGPSHLCFF
jgi:hypothetical protein